MATPLFMTAIDHALRIVFKWLFHLMVVQLYIIMCFILSASGDPSSENGLSHCDPAEPVGTGTGPLLRHCKDTPLQGCHQQS